MTGQIPDEVRYDGRPYALTAVDGDGLFDPASHGLEPGPLSTACWRGYLCRYAVHDGRLVLTWLEIGQAEKNRTTRLHGIAARVADERALHPGALRYQNLAAPVSFTGRLLIGGEYIHLGYLNMGFTPAWLFQDVHELILDGGRLVGSYDRSAQLADVRARLGTAGLRPTSDEARRDWIEQTFSLSFGYSWPTVE